MGFVTAALCGLVFGRQTSAPQKIWQGFGVNIHFTEPAPGEMDLLRASGVDYVRTDFNWDATEKATGKYDFDAYDRLLALLKNGNIRPVFVLDYGNKLYDSGAPKSVAAQDAYAAWAGAAISHFKGEEIVWEIWNEPNIDQKWRPRADAYSYGSLAVKAARIMRSADPNCRIIAPGTSRIDEKYLRKALTTELLGLIDGVSVHPYRASGPETVMKDYERVRSIIRTKAPAGHENLPVVCSEWGYSTARSTDVNEDRQAMYLSKLLILSACVGSPLTIYYDWRESGTDPKNIDQHFGIVKSNLLPKVSYDAIRLCTKAFKGCTYFKRMVKKDPLDWIIVGIGEGKMVRAMWYQKVGGLPRFEAYDMSDRSNRQLYNRLLTESKGTTIVPAPKDTVKVDPPRKDPQKKTPPRKDPPKKDQSPMVKTALTIAYAPPIDEEGWCALITKPASMANAKVEFRYDRKETGAAVTCFTNVRTERVIEPLANNDSDSQILALVSGQRIGDASIKRADLDPTAWQLQGGTNNAQVMTTKMGATVEYGLAIGALKASLAPKSSIPIPDGAKQFVIWIKPDGSNNNLFARFKDETGAEFKVFLGTMNADTDRNGWRAVVVPFVDLPSSLLGGGAGPKGRLEWVSVLSVEAADKNQPKSGTIEFGPAAYEL
jgi:hypothetical protein